MISISQNAEIAQIYHKMLNGDRSALSQLQLVTNKINPIALSLSSQVHTDRLEHKEQNQTISEAKKAETFQAFLKQKLAQIKISKQYPMHDVKNNEVNGGPQQRRRKLSKQLQKNQSLVMRHSKQLNKSVDIVNLRQSVSQNLNEKTVVSKKTVNAKSKQKQQPSKPVNRQIKKKQEKRLSDNLHEINKQQDMLQIQILRIHKKVSKNIQNLKKKQDIKQIDMKDLGKDKYSLKDIGIQNGNSKSIPEKILKISIEIAKCEQKIEQKYDDLNIIKKELVDRQNKIKNRQKKNNNSSLWQFLNSNQEILDHINQEESHNQHPRSDHEQPVLYRQKMIERRKKGWILRKRKQYNLQNGPNLINLSHFRMSELIQKPQTNTDQIQNRIIVNPKMAQMLLN